MINKMRIKFRKMNKKRTNKYLKSKKIMKKSRISMKALKTLK